MRSMSVPGALCICLAALSGWCAAIPSDAIHAGPVYTAAKGGNGVPTYPEVRILVEVPPAAVDGNAKPQNFDMRVDGGAPVAASHIEPLAATGYGMTLAVALDVSGSMKGAPLNAVRSGLFRFVDDAGPEDRIAILTIADDTRWDANWNDSRDLVRAALRRLASRGSLTRLWDALLEALERFPESPAARRMVVISDGHDEGSTHAEEEVIASARQHQIQMDAIGITRSRLVYLATLDRLAAETGGHYQRARSVGELENMVGNGISRLKALPVATFRAESLAGDGKTHSFEVTWKHDGVESKAAVQFQAPLQQAAPPAEAPASKSSDKSSRIWPIAAAVLAVLLIAGGMLLRSRKKRTTASDFQTQEALQPVRTTDPRPVDPSPAPQPAPAALALGMRASGPRLAALNPEPAPASGLLSPRSQTRITASFPRPEQGHPAAYLVCEAGNSAGRSFPVEATEYWIGALENNHLQIPDDPTVSGNHACIVFDHDVLGIYDYQSTNGTQVNDVAVAGSRRLLRPGDRIRIGRSTFTVQSATVQFSHQKVDLP